jgi:hypothetical protein
MACYRFLIVRSHLSLHLMRLGKRNTLRRISRQYPPSRCRKEEMGIDSILTFMLLAVWGGLQPAAGISPPLPVYAGCIARFTLELLF